MIVAALGADAALPPIPGLTGENVVLAEDLYPAPEKAGKKVVILGGGLVGCELAIYLGDLGHEVEILEMAPMLNSGSNILQGSSIQLQLRRLGITPRLKTRVTEITPEGVKAVGPEGETFIPGDTVAVALGRKPRREEAEALGFCAPEFIQLGDCVSPATIWQATETAFHMLTDI